MIVMMTVVLKEKRDSKLMTQLVVVTMKKSEKMHFEIQTERFTLSK